MDAAFWLARWRENRIGFHQQQINPYLTNHLSALQLAPGDSVFVPLCGKSCDMLWLRDQGYSVLGVEISELAVAAFFAENRLKATRERRGAFIAWCAPGITLLQGDYFDLTPADLGGIAAVYDRAALIALPAGDRPRYSAHLLSLLPATARVLLVTLEYDQREMQGPPFSVPTREVQTLFDTRFDVQLLAREDRAEGPPDRGAGLSMTEKAYLLAPR